MPYSPSNLIPEGLNLKHARLIRSAPTCSLTSWSRRVAWWISSPTRWQPMPRRTYRQRAEREIDRTRNHTRQEFVGWLEELVAANHIPPLLLATPETWDTPARPSICTAISQDSGSWRKSKMPCTRRSSRKMLWCNGFSAKIPKARELLTLSTSLECMFMSSPS